MGGESNLPSEESELVSLEKDFQEVISELTDDPKLTKFRIEYEKIHDALKRILEANGRLQRQNRELNAEIVSNSAKVAQVTKICQDDQATRGEIIEFKGLILLQRISHPRKGKYRAAQCRVRKSLETC